MKRYVAVSTKHKLFSQYCCGSFLPYITLGTELCVAQWPLRSSSEFLFSTTKPLVSKTPIATELLLRLQILSDQSLVIPQKPRIRLATPGRPQKCSTGLRCGCYFLPSQRRVWRAVANFEGPKPLRSKRREKNSRYLPLTTLLK